MKRKNMLQRLYEKECVRNIIGRKLFNTVKDEDKDEVAHFCVIANNYILMSEKLKSK